VGQKGDSMVDESGMADGETTPIEIDGKIYYELNEEADQEGWNTLMEQARRKHDSLKAEKEEIIKTEERKRNEVVANIFSEQANFSTITHKIVKYVQPIYYDKGKNWWIWNKTKKVWERVDEVDVQIIIKKALQISGMGSRSRRTELIENLRISAREQAPLEAKKDIVQFGGRSYNLSTKGEWEADHRLFITNNVPYTPSETEETPIMDKIFYSWMKKEGESEEDTQKKIRKLYEIIAYCCLRDYPIHRIFCLIGSGRNGKSTYLSLIEKFIGIENCASTELDSLVSNRFETANLYKKLVCIMGETNFNQLNKTSVIKKLSGQDLVSFEYKGKDSLQGVNYAKILIATNTLPQTTDKTEGYYRRWDITEFSNKFSCKKDILATIPEEEYHNLARKCINILPTLLIEREFTGEGSVEEKQKMYEEKSNPLRKFVQDNIKESFDGFIFKWEFRDKFLTFLKSNGYREWGEKEISSAVKSEFSWESVRKANESGDRWFAYVGVKWQEKASVKDVKDVNGNSFSFPYIENEVKHPYHPYHPDHDNQKLMKNIIKFVKSKEEIDYNSLKNLNPHITDELIEQMKTEGLIYEPRSGFLKVI